MPKKGEKMSEEHKKKIGLAHTGKRGRKLSDEHKKKIAEKMKGNQHTKGKKLSEETRRKISESLKGKVHSEESIRRVAEKLKGRKPSEKSLEALAKYNATKGPMPEEQRKKISERMKVIGKDPKYRKKLSEGQKKRHADPEKRKKFLAQFDDKTRKKMSEKAKEYFSDPKNKEKISAANRKARLTEYSDPERKAKRFNSAFRKKVSQNAKVQWANSEIREKMINSLNEAWQGESRKSRVKSLIDNQGNGINGKRYLKGYHDSPKAGRVQYKSSWELQVFQQLDSDDTVETYVGEPVPITYEIEGRFREYYPDLFIKYKSGLEKLVEIKPQWQVSDPINQAKFKAAKALFGNNFEVWTENELDNKPFL